MPPDRISATYRIETAHPIGRAVESMAGEQSTGTFVRVPGETDALRERFGARVERVTELEDADGPSLPGSRPPGGAGAAPRFRRAEVVLSWPLENVGPSLPNLLATVAGNLFELSAFSGLKLVDLDLPPAFGEAYPGPQFGPEGTRRLSGVEGRPIIGTIIKPSVGLAPGETAALVGTLIEAGIDFVKDDELMANPPHSPLGRRVEAVMRVVNDHADRTGKKAMIAFNITDEIDAMRRHHDAVLDAGGTCVMVSLNGVGLAGVAHLRSHSQLPIHGHRNGWGIYARHPMLGMEFAAYSTFYRLAGADHLHCNGLRNKFCEPDDSVVASARRCLAPLFGRRVMPVIASGQWAGRAGETYERIGSIDLMHVCGGGIMAHPDGVAAGVLSLRQAWEAALSGTPADEYARARPELRRALEAFGP
ncbi:ribulose-bisphosphate carboxylase large subunit family protein [Tautonia plasticadhaerens]|uniref:Ribulose bisphosphate carboxylase-like protein n=1 Tax=Tautonia plasticadhaerens TaxID=2527974 RepID=A0A518H1L7_9BACT|nr:ribulose-bisphosphate carboxylase large subunit family protein [Tautonia plasticadhaerens]QDV34725.1 Ribulose bisphosphate carboxylase-like protein [Tautonia plasticadhaerens]